MPPKRGVKRDSSLAGDEGAKKPAAKRSKSSTDVSTSSSYPWTNKGIPDSVSFPPAGDNNIRISAWNVAGLNACWKKGFAKYVEAEDADILILTETKVSDRPADPLLTKKYRHQYWSQAAQKGYAGTAILSKYKPLSVSYTLDHSLSAVPGAPKLNEDDVKGRLVTLEFEKYWVVGTYVPNAGEALKNMDRKEAWHSVFEAHLRKLDATKPVIWGGDLNVAPTAKDLRNDLSNWNKTAGYTEQETSAFARVLAGPEATSATIAAALTTVKKDATEKATETHTTTVVASKAGVEVRDVETKQLPTPEDSQDKDVTVESVATTVATTTLSSGAGPMIDVWRKLHPEDEHYSYFSYRFGARQKGMGWRIDHYVVSERLFPDVVACEIRNEIYGASDHCPIIMDIKGSL